MKVSCKWLREFVDIPFDNNELAKRITMAGLEVEEIAWQAQNISRNILVAEIVSIEPHPSSEKLKICKINTGNETVTVVSGAPNISMHAKVAFVSPGTQLGSKKKVEKITILGVDSCGMFCSEEDLGLVDESSGIIILSDSIKPGEKASEHIETEDAIMEVAVTPNRPDCLSIIGIAREVAALTGNSLKLNKIKLPEIGLRSSEFISITIEAPDLCTSYTGRVIKNIKVEKSPSWMQRRLKASGIRSINNIVDTTNYVLIETGHPLHAFDCNTIKGKKIIVRRSREGETIVTLDGTERKLSEGMLLIADEKGGIAIAGVMGGKDTEVTDRTSDILIESAYFIPSSIRRTSKALSLSTEASYRFERGADPEILEFASDRVSQMAAMLAGGKICSGIVGETIKKHQSKFIHLRDERLSSILGIKIQREKIMSILQNLGMQVKTQNEGGLSVSPSSYRHDIENETDIIEEVARINGYEKIPSLSPVITSELIGKEDNRRTAARKLKSELVRMGFNEVINFSFINPSDAAKLGIDSEKAVSIKNPLSEEQSIMRTSLLAGLILTASLNTKRYNPDLRIFETGKVYLPDSAADLPNERLYLSALISGKASSASWLEKPRDADFFDLKGAIETLADARGIHIKFEPFTHNIQFLSIAESADIIVNGTKCGFAGKISKDLIELFELKAPAYIFEIDLDSIEFPDRSLIKFSPLSKIPPSYRDIAVVVPDNISSKKIMQCIADAGGKILEAVTLFDLYKGKPVADGKKSLAFSLTFRGKENTLTDQEISETMKSILNSLEKDLKAEIRS
ncbi:MAG: phenylalanine--tRNA ligase subunit beta [Candidatus Schekmanbacteria bacterium]|nr:phenylalanine--tRNA ligase subunit beta [Candidatus Schekmanbacteria bacterium]